MTLSARNWAWDSRRVMVDGEWRPIRPSEKLTLLCIAEMESAEEGCAWPSIRYIAERTGLSERQVQTNVNLFVALGVLKRTRHRSTRGRWDRNVYVLSVPREFREKDDAWEAFQG